MKLHSLEKQVRQEILKEITGKHGIAITSYESFRVYEKDILEYPWVYVILDEGQKIRNKD